MATLDVLDYQAALDAALARPQEDGKPRLAAPLRKQALREARRVIEMMAFRFAVLDDRPLPEDLDYLRALEAMRAPDGAARVLARRRPVYARARRRRLTTTYVSLAAVVLFAAAIVYVATLEEAEELALVSERVAVETTHSFNRTFEVTPDMNRLHVDGTLLPDRGSGGTIEVRLVDPAGRAVLAETFVGGGNIYLRRNVVDPQPGEWTLLVDFNAVKGSARVSVDGIRPAR